MVANFDEQSERDAGCRQDFYEPCRCKGACHDLAELASI
jgi:hypothetical protein